MAEEGNVDELKVKAIIGFDGSNRKGFFIHPDGQHVVYALGNKVTIQNYYTKEQRFLEGHNNIISAIDLSPSGKYIASGQINHIGFKARLIIWDFNERKMNSFHEFHKVRVEAVAFSKNEQYCISLGGRDCGFVVVWNVASRNLVCGAQVARGVQGEAFTLNTMNLREMCFITCGDNHLAVWKINSEARNVQSIDVKQTKIRRSIVSVVVNERDEYAYCGTTTGDLLKVKLNYSHDPNIVDPKTQPTMVRCLARITKKKLPSGFVLLYCQGICSLMLLNNELIIIGAGDGLLDLVEEVTPVEQKGPIKCPSIPALRSYRSTNVHASVNSIQVLTKGEKKYILAATANCEIFQVDFETFDCELTVTCHTSTIYALTFPHEFSEVFATASKNDIRVWSMKTTKELLRIIVQNFSCTSIKFTYDGKAILSGWNDGVIRSFTPLTGRLIYSIYNAHNKGVSALTINQKGDLLVSGGCEGQIRLWSISPYRQQLICTLKEHKAPISTVDLNCTGDEAVSSAADGSCVIWDIVRRCRRQILFANSLFMCARYFPTGVQILTCGSDRKLAYWETLDGSLIREIEGSRTGTINTLDISEDGLNFVTGGNDQIVKYWLYNEGIVTHVGLGHSGVITATQFSPDMQHIITASASGEIFIWETPFKEKAQSENVPLTAKPSSVKEEVIHDLPSVRSEASHHSHHSTKSNNSSHICPEPEGARKLAKVIMEVNLDDDQGSNRNQPC